MNEWTPPQSVEYRAPAEGLGVLRKMLEGLSRRISALEGTAPLKQAGIRARPGQLASLDFDGDGTHTDLGTQGWMLGGDPSFLALNGIDVIADLAAKDVTILGLISDLAATQATLAAQVDLLTAVADVKYAESTTQVSGFTGFYTGTTPSVTLSTPSGRIEIAYGGSLNGGEGYFCFSVTGAVSGAIVTAAAVQANPARRVAVTGGASFAPSGHRSMVVTVPPNEALTVRLAYYAASTFVYFFGGSILARVTP